MRGRRLLLDQEIIVAHLEGIIESVGAGFLRRLVGGGKGEPRAVGLPRELLNGSGVMGELLCVAARHVENEDLVVLVPVLREERHAVSGRRPARKRDGLAIVGEVALLAGGDVDVRQLRQVQVLFIIRTGDHGHQRLTVGGKLWIRNTDDLAHPGKVEGRTRRRADRQTGPRGRGCRRIRGRRARYRLARCGCRGDAQAKQR